jgi:DNA repair photolyase
MSRSSPDTAETLTGRVAELVAPLRTAPGGWALHEIETEQGVRLLFRRWDGAALAVELEAADPGRPCYATTRRFNVYFALRSPARRDLEEDERLLLDHVVAVIRRREGALPVSGEAPPASRRVLVREIEREHVLVAEETPRAYYLNPYVGCMLGCRYCYAIHRADFSRSLEGAPPAAWGRWVDVKTNAPEVLARELREVEPGTVRMSPIVTDPYQPIERRYRITRRCLEVMAPTQFTPVVLSRASMVLEDAGLLARCHGAIVGMSVPTDDDRVRAEIEPGTESIEARIATLRALREAGLTTFAVLQPMLPLDPARTVDLIAPWVQAVRIGPLFEKHRIADSFARLGRMEALSERWERETFEDLRSRFEARGVPVNPTTEPWSSFL